MKAAKERALFQPQKKIRFTLILLATMAVVMGGTLWLRQKNTRATSTATVIAAPAEKSDLGENILLACAGRVEGRSETVGVSAAIDGLLREVRVVEGQQVSAGETIALIDCAELHSELQTALAQVESTRQARVRLARGNRDEEKRVAAANKTAVEAVLLEAKLQNERMTSLYDSGVVARDLADKARRDLDVATASLRAATDRQSLAEASALPEELAQADAEIRAAEERVKMLSARQNKCAVKAPVSGTILRIHLQAGEFVSTVFPQAIVSLGDLSTLRIRAEVDERDLAHVSIGQKVLARADAFPQQKISGVVASVGALMGRKKVLTGDPADKNDRDVLEVLIDLPSPATEGVNQLTVGLRMTVQFLAK